MSRLAPIKLIAFGALLTSLTYASLERLRSDGMELPGEATELSASGEITVPVEIIETGEAPSVRTVRVQSAD